MRIQKRPLQTAIAASLALFGTFALATACLAADRPGKTPKPGANPGAFITETMRVHMDGHQSDLAMWLPYEFFVVCGEAQGESREATDRTMGILQRYHIVCAARMLEHPHGPQAYATEDQLRDSVVLQVPGGQEVKSLATVPPKVSAMAAAMQRGIAAQGGELTQHMHLLFFPAQTPDGKTIVDAGKKDKLTIELKAVGLFKPYSYTWHTPFDAAQAPETCPKCKEEVSGKWTFCPWCGNKLEQQK